MARLATGWVFNCKKKKYYIFFFKKVTNNSVGKSLLDKVNREV